MRARYAALCLAFWAGGTAAAEGPLSAIDWLSDSVAAPQQSGPLRGSDITTNALPQEIAVTPLGQPLADAVGLLPPSATGLPRALWGTATSDEIIARLDAVPLDLMPSLRRLLTTLLLAEANPAVDSGPEDRLLLARVDRLLAMAALDRASALLDRAGPETPERFRRYFDVALLRGNETQACARMRARPEISPTYPARIFCLARGGDWQAAAVTLETAEALGILSPEEDALLARFLDPDILDETGNDTLRRAPTPLIFRMLEAVGEPVPTGTLPLAYAWADLRPTRGWKAQLEAGERLARNGALPANQLTGIYLRQRPSASGGVWERAKAMQTVQNALASGDTDALSKELPAIWATMRNAGLGLVLAEQYGGELADLSLDGAAGDLAFEIGLMSPAYEEIALAARLGTPRARFLAAIARGVPEQATAPDTLSLAVRDGFLADGPPPALDMLVREGRVGEAILRAITLFSEGAQGDPDGISDAIALLRALGLEQTARRASLELLIEEARG
ncbi:MAG: hypothetical protein HKO95_07685 [Rhodobacteraceae bacterium]|nr:hypothetical protein [Alphaproteobacteria bacterium]NNK66602.1 hypothetical protein [Paracoccaceae bacterium]